MLDDEKRYTDMGCRGSEDDPSGHRHHSFPVRLPWSEEDYINRSGLV